MLPDGGPYRKAPRAAATYVRAPVPLHFPSEAEMPETTLHLLLRTFLYQLLKFTFGASSCVGSDQFVYWRASDPRTCLAPDAFLKLGTSTVHFDSWKTWERGTPELAVEIDMGSARRKAWDEKEERYGDLGVRELVRFDPEAAPGERLRVWDRVDDDRVERVIMSQSAESAVLGCFWVVSDVEGTPGLRLAEDAAGQRLLPSQLETEVRAREAEARAREAETRAREAAERRVQELEAELKRRG